MSGAVDAVQEVVSEDRPAGQRQRLVEEGPSLFGFVAGEVDLGQPLQRVGFAEGRVELVVQRGGVAQLAFGRVEVTGEQRRLTDQRGRERGGSERAAAFGRRAHGPGQVDHLGVRRRPVEHVLGRAEVAVEHGVGDLRGVAGAAQLGAHAVEPLAAVVGEEPLQRHQVEHLPAALAAEDPPLRLLADGPGGVEVGGEVGDVGLGEQDLGVVLAVHADAVEGGGGGGDVAGHDRGARQAGAELGLDGGRCAVEGVAIGPDGGRVADGQQEVGPQGEETAAVLGLGRGRGSARSSRGRPGRRRPRPRSPRPSGSRPPPARPHRLRGGGSRSAPARRRALRGGRRRRGGSAGAGAVGRRGATRRARVRGGTGSRPRSPRRRRR